LPTRGFRLAWLSLVGLFVVALLAPPLVLQGARVLVEGALTALDEVSALAAARVAGRPVEVLNDRTEFSDTFANPSGTFTWNEGVTPVRARGADGVWAPVDYTLRARPGGTVAPASSVADVVFSGGGSGTMARIGRGGYQVSLGWLGVLPAPTLSGSIATYPDVLPGVDLQLTAQPLGFSTLLVVKTAEAARNPALGVVRLPLATRNVTLTATSAGGLSAVDGVDTEVFSAPSAAMWDSSGAGRASVGVRVVPGELDLLPDRGMLASPSTRFPVSIDPAFSVTGTQANWTKINDCFKTQAYWNGANDTDAHNEGSMKVGMSPSGYGDSCDGMAWRTYFMFNTAAVQGKNVISLSFNAFETWAASCNAKPVDLYVTGQATSTTTWNSPPGSPPGNATLLQEQSFAHGWSSTCPGSSVVFNKISTPSMLKLVSAHNPMSFMLRAPNESHCFADSTHGDTCQWKRFDSGVLLNSQRAFLSIQYNTPPNVPSGLYTSGSPYLYPNGHIPCNGNANYVNTLTPTMHASIGDPDDSGSSQTQALTAIYSWTGGTAGSVKAGGRAPGSGNPTLATSALIPTTAGLANGTAVDWTVVAADDGGLSSDPSATCHLTIDTTEQQLVPGITSADYPDNTAAKQVGAPGTVTFDPNGASSVAGYLYGLNTSTPWKFVAAGTDGTATVTIVPPVVGLNPLNVQIIGLGGNLGPVKNYKVVTGHNATGSVLLYQLAMDEGTGTVLDDKVGFHTTTAAGATSWVAGHNSSNDPNDHAVHFAASPGGYLQTSEPTVDTANEFTVSAWVRLDDTAAGYRILSQDDVPPGTSGAVGVAGYYLESTAGTAPRWEFSAPTGDVLGAPVAHAVSDAAPSVGVWTHLVGVFCMDPTCMRPGDPGLGRVYLYVDDVLQSVSGQDDTSWQARGPMQIGRGTYRGLSTDPNPNYSNLLNGSVDDVSVYWGDPCPSPASASPSCTNVG
jgi:hypothetical protein